MKKIIFDLLKTFIGVLVFAITTFSYGGNRNIISSTNTNTKDNNLIVEQEINPFVDGFLPQASGGIFNATSTSAELKRFNGFNREVYLTFNLSNLTINSNSAKLKIFCQSFDKFGDLNISLYCLPEYQTSGLTWSTRPLVSAAVASIWITPSEHANTFLEFNISSCLASILATQSKQATFVLRITSGNDALVKFSMNESTTNKPSLILSDAYPVNGGVSSTIKMPTLFSDNMVIQRDKPIKIWGEVLPNKSVDITFDGQIYKTQSDINGNFTTLLPPKIASSSSYVLTVSSNNESFSYKNIVMGDVYLCGGQSNMLMTVSGIKPDQLANATADSNYPNLRFFDVAKIVSGGFVLNAPDNPWKSAISNRVVSWSAVAFFVGRDLHKDINVPIGLINVSHGGAPTDAFISPQAYIDDLVLNAAKRPNDPDPIIALYTTPSSLYASMISKIAGYPIKAVLWYQAEANASFWQSYKTIFKGLIKDWRTQFNEPTLPWLFVQLPGFSTGGSTNLTWAETRDIQLQVSKEDPTTRMAVTIDLGEEKDIHPKDKYTVAKRMLPQVKALVYGEQITHKSPIYQSHEVQGADMILSFDNVGSGLTATKAITEFEIAGPDKIYKPAIATLLSDNRIKLSNATVINPVFARYAFLNYTTASIYTTDALSLPLSPFKTESGGTLSVSDFGQDATSLLVYPNPTNGILNIKKTANPENIQVYNLAGTLVYNGKFTNKLDLSFLAKGFYFVKTDLNQIVKIIID